MNSKYKVEMAALKEIRYKIIFNFISQGVIYSKEYIILFCTFVGVCMMKRIEILFQGKDIQATFYVSFCHQFQQINFKYIVQIDV